MRSIVSHQFRRNCISSKLLVLYIIKLTEMHTSCVEIQMRLVAFDDIHAIAWLYTKPVSLDKKTLVLSNKSFLAPPAGLEPATSWLTVMRSTDWAKEEYEQFDQSQTAILYILMQSRLV